ncbi:MAG: hypothetical protein ACRD5K_04335 [Candidatus Acidiferrales bacterium]
MATKAKSLDESLIAHIPGAHVPNIRSLAGVCWLRFVNYDARHTKAYER